MPDITTSSSSYYCTFKRGDLCRIHQSVAFVPNEAIRSAPLIVIEIMPPSEALRRLLAQGGIPEEKIEEYVGCVIDELEDEISSVIKVLYPDGSTHEFFDYELEHY